MQRSLPSTWTGELCPRSIARLLGWLYRAQHELLFGLRTAACCWGAGQVVMGDRVGVPSRGCHGPASRGRGTPPWPSGATLLTWQGPPACDVVQAAASRSPRLGRKQNPRGPPRLADEGFPKTPNTLKFARPVLFCIFKDYKSCLAATETPSQIFNNFSY